MKARTRRELGGRRLSFILPLAVLASYAAALVYARDQAPPGLSTDVAEEALRGLYLVENHRFEVITFAIGSSAETLYLYLLGGAAKLLGPTTLAVQVVSWAFGLACIWLAWKLVERISDTVPRWIPLLTAAGSLWLFHYARSGLRGISAPFFLAAFALLLDRADRRPADRTAGLLCGAVLGVSIYAYTSARVLVIAFAAYAVLRLIRRHDKAAVLHYGTIATGALVASIPNLLFFFRQPKEFLTRGSYTLMGSGIDLALNVLWSALLPISYPDYFRDNDGPTYLFDGVSAGLTASGRNPVNIVFAAALLAGLWQARRFLGKPVVSFFLCTWTTSILFLGLSGPSLTRMLVVWPIFVAFAALGFGLLVERAPVLRVPALLLILVIGTTDLYLYLSRFGEAPTSSIFFGSVATPMGQTAENLAARGQRVLCIVSKDANVIRYLTHDQSARVKVAEFFRRPLDPAEAPIQEFRPNYLLIERLPRFNDFLARFPVAWRVAYDSRFEYLRLPPQ